MNLEQLLSSVTDDQRAAIIALRDEVTAAGVSNAAKIVEARTAAEVKVKELTAQIKDERAKAAEQLKGTQTALSESQASLRQLVKSESALRAEVEKLSQPS